MRTVNFCGKVISICDLTEIAEIADVGQVDGMDIDRLSSLVDALGRGEFFKGLLFGFRENERRSGRLMYEYYVERAQLYRVNLEYCQCSQCGLSMKGCNVRMYDLYVDCQTPDEELTKAMALPYVRCPRCNSELPRKYFCISTSSESEPCFAA